MNYPNVPSQSYFGANAPAQSYFGAAPPRPAAGYEAFFKKHGKNRRTSRLAIRGRALVGQLKELRRERGSKSNEIETARARIPTLQGALVSRQAEAEDAKRAYRRVSRNPFATRAQIRRKSRAWNRAQDKVEEAQHRLSDKRNEIAHLVEELERLRSEIRGKRSQIAGVIQRIKAKIAAQKTVEGKIGEAKVAADEAVLVAVDAQKESADSQVHDARAAIAAQARELQEAVLQFQDLQARYASAAAKVESKGDDRTDADVVALQALQAELITAGMDVLSKMMAMSLVDLTPLSMAESEETEEVVVVENVPGIHHDPQLRAAIVQTMSKAPRSTTISMAGHFGLVPNWAYDYDLTGATWGGAYYTPQFGNEPAGQPPAQGQQPAQGGNAQDAMGWVNAIGNATGQVMGGIGAILWAVGNNQNLTPQQQQNLYNAQQGMYNTGQVLTGQQPPQSQWGPQQPQQPPPGYYPPQTAAEGTNWMPWVFGGVAVLGLGALTWALLSN